MEKALKMVLKLINILKPTKWNHPWSKAAFTLSRGKITGGIFCNKLIERTTALGASEL